MQSHNTAPFLKAFFVAESLVGLEKYQAQEKQYCICLKNLKRKSLPRNIGI